MNAIDALENAIALLKEIARGQKVSAGEILLNVKRYDAALEEHREQQMKNDRRRQQIRELAATARDRKGLTA